MRSFSKSETMYNWFVLFFLISSQTNADQASQDEISNKIQTIATNDLHDSVMIDVFLVKLRHIEVSDFKTLKNVGNSVWIKGEESDTMNLTLKLDDFKIKMKEVHFGPTRLSGTFEIGENEAEVALSAKSGSCKIDLIDYRMTKMNKVIFRTDMQELDGKDVSEIFQDFAVPIINKIAKTKWFQDLTKAIFGKLCKINFLVDGSN